MQLHNYGEPLSIGGPTPNNNVYVLDDSMKPVPIGQPGIMWAGGAGITCGYVNLPDKTAERYKLDIFANDGYVAQFVIPTLHSLIESSSTFMFNTGDLGRWRADGTLEHLGRIDDQVKVKVRIHISFISHVLT